MLAMVATMEFFLIGQLGIILPNYCQLCKLLWE